MSDLLVAGIGHLTTNDPGLGTPFGVVTDAAVAITGGQVSWVGPAAETPTSLREDRDVVHVDGRAVVPGFVDAHTHVVFAGHRADEFAARLEGRDYTEILAQGGGIQATVAATRAAGDEELFRQSRRRVAHMLATGTTTLEIKSGYGLDVATERKMLEVARRLGDELPVDVVGTFLGAHVVPGEFRGQRRAYVDLVAGPMLDACAPLARFCDVFCDEPAFTVAEARHILEEARRRGLGLKIHAEQLAHTGGARLAADLGAVSADHLDHATDEDLEALRQAGTVAVLLPGAALSMRTHRPDATRIWESGVTVAVATDCNPGTSWIETMPFTVALASLELGLAPMRSLWAATRGGALALGLPDRGMLAPGAAGDLVVLDADSPLHLAYRPDADLVTTVVKGGVVVA